MALNNVEYSSYRHHGVSISLTFPLLWNAIYDKKIICKYEEEHKYSH